jgi:hypothetical protein
MASAGQDWRRLAPVARQASPVAATRSVLRLINFIAMDDNGNPTGPIERQCLAEHDVMVRIPHFLSDTKFDHAAPSGTPRVRHAAPPVIRSTKWIATR